MRSPGAHCVSSYAGAFGWCQATIVLNTYLVRFSLRLGAIGSWGACGQTVWTVMALLSPPAAWFADEI